MRKRRNVRVRPPTKRSWRPFRTSRRRRYLRYPLPQYGAGVGSSMVFSSLAKPLRDLFKTEGGQYLAKKIKGLKRRR